ncbi:MAG: succinate dehydrogenase assembly factor 2 [Rhodocyclales bacterium]|nr:succinate dehydrogenase assembly factor 2 [Rhodocyclales bacterium]MBK9595013.1 succinate dehydrogenase assembly factor 2 [Rhodocyclales bacterium]
MPSERADDQGRQQQRLRWHCRRALLELDLVFQRFWLKAGDGLGDEDAAALERLLEMEDHDLWELVSGRRETDDPRLKGIVAQLRQA